METIQIGDLSFVVAPEEALVDEKKRLATNSKPKQRAKPRKHASQGNQILARARQYKVKNVRRVGQGGLIDSPIKLNGWLVTPKEVYRGIIPRAALETAELLTKGINIKGFVVADDLRHIEQKRSLPALVMPKVSPDWKKIALGAGKVAAVIAVVGAVISLFPLVLGVGAVGAALAYDPLLIAVTAEDEWICVYEWWH